MATESTSLAPRDEQLVLAALEGDLSSFGDLVERYWRMAYALALSRVHDAMEAEDIAQESFLKAHGQLHKLRHPSRFAGWLSRIILQQCTDSVRKNVRRGRAAAGLVEAVDLETIPAHLANPGLTESQIEFVRQRVARLPEKLGRLIIMRFTTGLSAVEIAAQLGKRPGTVRVWLHRAYQRLRKDLAGLLEEFET